MDKARNSGPSASANRFAHLLQPGRIGKITLHNRVVMPAMGTNQADADGFVTAQVKSYYAARANGGAGLIIVENSVVDFPQGKAIQRALSADNDKYVPGLTELADVIHRGGAKAALQLVHAGSNTSRAITHSGLVAPSPLAMRPGENPRELSLDEIERLIGCFAGAALRAKMCGFDAVEIHGAHAFLISQFLSSAWNQRSDRFGGTLEAKARFLTEIIGRMKLTVGADFPVICRLTGEEYGIPGGITIDETRQVARLVAKAGADALHVSAWGVGSYSNSAPAPRVAGSLVYLAEAVKKEVTIPVIAVGGLDHELGEAILSEGKADFVAMGRALIADPDLPGKVAQGHLEAIRPCILCNVCYSRVGFENEKICCAVNAAAGRESECQIVPASKPKRVLVIGGGPAGMEAARLAALRGHEVTLIEKNGALGGQLLPASKVPWKGRFGTLARYFETQIRKLGVTVRLAETFDGTDLRSARFDAAVIAVGPNRALPKIEGLTAGRLVSADDVLMGRAEVGREALVLGGGQVALEVAHFLSSMDKSVTVVTDLPRAGTGMVATVRRELLDTLSKRGVRILTDLRYEAFSGDGLLVRDKQGSGKTLRADTIISALPGTSAAGLAQTLTAQTRMPVSVIGDAAKNAGIREAVAAAHDLALSL